MTKTLLQDRSTQRRGWTIGLLILLVLGIAIGASQVMRERADRVPIATKARALPVPQNLPGFNLTETPKIDPEIAKKLNAEQPFLAEAPVPARPFRLNTGAADMNKAVDCLAAAIHYEAASETLEGKKAVAQVVLNRMRHPAYPKTVCGVVFQGAERTDRLCQFTFACDGAMTRPPSPASWKNAQTIAKVMLAGAVYAPVGWATHYHTDWVFPYWSKELDKVRQEGTHLFFRWKKFWGTPAAFRGRYAGNEGNQSRLAGLSAFHLPDATPTDLAATTSLTPIDPLAPPPTADGTVPTAKGGAFVMPGGLPPVPGSARQTFTNANGDYYMFHVNKGVDPQALVALALQSCGAKPYCKVMVWTDPKIVPTGLPVSDEALSKLTYSYLRNRYGGFDKSLWNCQIFAGRAPAQCIKHQSAAPITAATTQAASAP